MGVGLRARGFCEHCVDGTAVYARRVRLSVSWSLSARVCVCFFVLNACFSVPILY